MALFEILRFYKTYHARRLEENLSQRELLKRELILIGWALVAIVVLAAFFLGLVWYFTR